MNAYPLQTDSIVRINQELSRAANAEPGLSLADARSALVISDACITFRRIRTDLDDYLLWLEVHAGELVPLIRLLAQIADAACRARR